MEDTVVATESCIRIISIVDDVADYEHVYLAYDIRTSVQCVSNEVDAIIFNQDLFKNEKCLSRRSAHCREH